MASRCRFAPRCILLAGFPEQIDVLLGHKEAVDTTPDGAVLLMTGRVCPIQMFRVGKNVYATQFHPEADADEFTLRIDTYRNHGYFQPHEADELKKRVSLKPTPYAQKILRRFRKLLLLILDKHKLVTAGRVALAHALSHEKCKT